MFLAIEMQINSIKIENKKDVYRHSKSAPASLSVVRDNPSYAKASMMNYLSYSPISFRARMEEHLGQGARYLGDGKIAARKQNFCLFNSRISSNNLCNSARL